jgi:hypothetical protein
MNYPSFHDLFLDLEASWNKEAPIETIEQCEHTIFDLFLAELKYMLDIGVLNEIEEESPQSYLYLK